MNLLHFAAIFQRLASNEWLGLVDMEGYVGKLPPNAKEVGKHKETYDDGEICSASIISMSDLPETLITHIKSEYFALFWNNNAIKVLFKDKAYSFQPISKWTESDSKRAINLGKKHNIPAKYLKEFSNIKKLINSVENELT